MTEPSTPAEAAEFYLSDATRRNRAFWRLAREEADRIMRPLVAKEIERLAPQYAQEIADAALTSAQQQGRMSDWSARQLAERAIGEALRHVEIVIRPKPLEPEAPATKKRR